MLLENPSFLLWWCRLTHVDRCNCHEVVVFVAVMFSRWLLVLFARDFHHVNDVVRLWDGLFADGVDLDLIDYVFVAVLLFLKDDRTYL